MADPFDFWKLVAGLGVFLFGMRQLELGLKQLAGKGFRHFLRHSTDSPISSILGGTIATTIVQSSSLVGLIVLALVGANIIPLSNAIGIVLGSNLGTTFTGWIVATIGFKLDLQAVSLPMLGIGALGTMLPKSRYQSFAFFLLGLALILMGLEWMKSSVSQMSAYLDIQKIKDYPPIIFLLVGLIFTAIIRSSSATIMITLAALNAGEIQLPAAAAIVIGADLGTTSTVLLGSLQGAIAKRRVAMAHVSFNFCVDSLAFLALIPLLSLIQHLSITDPLFTLVAFHSLFNLLGIALFYPFLKPFARVLMRYIPETKTEVRRYLQNVPADVTDVAQEALINESRHLINMVATLNLRLLHIDPGVIVSTNETKDQYTQWLTGETLKHYEAVKILEGNIINYSLEMQAGELDKKVAACINMLLDAIRHAIYSAKSLKDIRDNINQIKEIEDSFVSNLFTEIQGLAAKTYRQIFQLLSEKHETNYLLDELAELKERVGNFYVSNEKQLYANAKRSGLSDPNLSTLLNVNKEVNTSFKAFFKAVIPAWIEQEDEQLN